MLLATRVWGSEVLEVSVVSQRVASHVFKEVGCQDSVRLFVNPLPQLSLFKGNRATIAEQSKLSCHAK